MIIMNFCEIKCTYKEFVIRQEAIDKYCHPTYIRYHTLSYYMYICVCLYIYIYIERERERDRERHTHISLSLSLYIYIYIYIFSYNKGPAAPCPYQRSSDSRGFRRAGGLVHPVSIARSPLRRFSPGAGLLRCVFFIGGG